MKEEKEDSIDKLFNRGLSDPGSNASYREEDWDKFEAMLDNNRPKNIVRRIILLGGAIAAMLLLALGFFYFNNLKQNKTQPAVTKTKPQKLNDSGTYGLPLQQPADLKSNTLSANSRKSATGISRKSKSFFALSAAQGGRNTTGIKEELTTVDYKQPKVEPNENKAARTDSAASVITMLPNKAAKDTTPPDAAAIADKPVLASVTNDIKPKKKPVSTGAFKPTLSLSLIASPDINSVEGFSQNKLGTNAGLIFTLGLSKKWSISTGAVYADKPYTTPFSHYTTSYAFSTKPTTVNANCIVLDIPVNIGYQFYSRNGNKLSLGTGLSSYFMLRERYTFNYPAYSEGGPPSYNISNKNKHIMGILNLNATYQREVSSKFGIGIQPYLKLPLTSIGYGQVNLKSAGVAVGVTWNINSAAKP